MLAGISIQWADANLIIISRVFNPNSGLENYFEKYMYNFFRTINNQSWAIDNEREAPAGSVSCKYYYNNFLYNVQIYHSIEISRVLNKNNEIPSSLK